MRRWICCRILMWETERRTHRSTCYNWNTQQPTPRYTRHTHTHTVCSARACKRRNETRNDRGRERESEKKIHHITRILTVATGCAIKSMMKARLWSYSTAAPAPAPAPATAAAAASSNGSHVIEQNQWDVFIVFVRVGFVSLILRF